MLDTSDNEETNQVAGKTVRLLALGIVMQPSPDAEPLAPGDGSQQTHNKDYIQTDNLQGVYIYMYVYIYI